MKHREELAKLIPTNGHAVELGVAKGLFSEALLANQTGFKLVSVDSWMDEERGHGEAEFQEASRLLAHWDPRSIIMRRSFQDAAGFFPHKRLDLVYCDGYAHTGQDNGRTLWTWWHKVKDGGIFAGHDYHPRWPETMAAVDAFCKKLGLRFELTTDDEYASWWVRK